MFKDIIILAGGIGERLWPLSTKSHPKQFIVTPEGLSFFQLSLKRAMLLSPSRSILVVTRGDFEALTLEHCAAFREGLSARDAGRLTEKLVILAEPCPRHTAAAVELALAWLRSCDSPAPDDAPAETPSAHTPARALVLTSDHIISTDAQFVSSCQKAARAAEGGFVCFAIPPSFPATGFGYIEAGAAAPGEERVYEVRSFKEKPGEAAAREFLQKGNYWWNSGMFAFDEDFYCAEIKKYEPELAAAFSALTGPEPETAQGIKLVKKWKNLEAVYGAVEPVSIDSAVAERTAGARCVIAEFLWDDIGSWDAFAACAPSSQKNAVLVESADCSVYSDIPVALCGVSGLIVAINKGKALVMRKGRSALVREAVRETARLS